MVSSPPPLRCQMKRKDDTYSMILSTEHRHRRVCIVLVLCLTLAVFGSLGASAASTSDIPFPKGAVETPVLLNGAEVLEGECFRINGVTYVPLRNFSSLFGSCTVSWNGSTNTATVKTAALTLYAATGNYYIYANDHYLYTVEKVLNLNGHLYVPIRPMALAFAASLNWNAALNRVELSAKMNGAAISYANYRSDEVYWLSRIISAESRGEPFLGQIAVGNVVLNRVASSAYPNTIYEVIVDRKYGTQFSPVSFGTIYNPPTESAVIAAKICLEGYSLSNSILFFMNPRYATTNWIAQARPYAFTIGSHDFYN